MQLPDGTQIRVLRMNKSSARVRIVRPADTSAPTFDTSGLACVGSTCTFGATDAMWDKSGPSYDLPTDLVTDNFWVAQARATVDGSVGAPAVRPVPGVRASFDLGIRPLTVGRHSIALEATDAAGNTASGRFTVTAPTPTMDWQELNSLSFAWVRSDHRRCYVEGLTCIVAAVRAKVACPTSASATFTAVDIDGNPLDTVVARTNPLAVGQLGGLVAVTHNAETYHWNVSGISCS